MTAVRAVGFDLDGTLFDHHGSARAGVDEFVRSLGLPVTEAAIAAWFRAESEQFERWRSGRIGFAEQRRERLRTVLPQWGLRVPSEAAELDTLFDGYLRAYEASWRAFPDSLPLLREVRSSGYRVGLLTNGAEAQQLEKVRRTGLLEAFDVVCTSERLGAPKPEARAFELLASELGVPPSACLFVGDDADHDVAGARAAGMRAVLIDRSGRDEQGIGATVREALAG